MNPKEQKRLQRAKMWKYAQHIHTQGQLEDILLQISTPHKRGVCFELIKPMLKFEASYPDHIAKWDSTMKVG